MNTEAQAHAAPQPPALAELIYVELVGRAFLRADNTAIIKPAPAELARLSLELARVFRDAEQQLAAESGPKNVGYDLTAADWIK